MKTGGITAKGLVVKKGSYTILDSLTFEVKQGLLTGLIGPSGSGKTTLMRSIIGVQIPTKGVLTVSGEPAGAKSLRSRIGYVTQASSIYEDITVEQNLSYFASLSGVGKQAVAKALKHVDLMPQRKQLAHTLSGGQKARVSLAIALLGESDVLVLDEPTVGLDPVLRQSLWDLFARLAKAGRTIIVSSHVMDEADRCDDVLLLRDGALLWAGSRAGLWHKARADSTEAAFLNLVRTP